jgi:dTDP-4-amino-4,6-dideoxygalactose transaminase
MLNTPFSPWPCFAQDEQEAVAAVLASGRVNYWTGSECRRFEEEFANWARTKHAIALANGTVALDAALHALGLGHGDEVVVTPRTFIASVSCVANAGAVPVFADVDRDSQNISADTIARALTPRTKAILCVHLAGWPCEMDGIMKLAAERGLSVIEDCAQAHGARYNGRPVGSIGHIGAWSFCQDKIMTSGGEGGMVTTNDERLFKAMWSYKDHGKSYDAVLRATGTGFQWLHESFGTNARMTEMQAAIARLQLRKLDQWSERRQRYAHRIWKAAAELRGLRVPVLPRHVVHACYKCYVFVDRHALKSGWSRDRIIGEIGALGVPCYSGSCSEVYLEKAFEGTSFRPATRLPVARELGETSLMFLVNPTLTEAEIDRTSSVLKEVMSLAAA